MIHSSSKKTSCKEFDPFAAVQLVSPSGESSFVVYTGVPSALFAAGLFLN
jgi:hypothetical protein